MKAVVIKCGGSVLDELSPNFFEAIHSLKKDGYSPVIVHGGGPAINAMLDLHQIDSKFHNGLRVTNGETMEIVEMVLSGKTNRQLVRLLEKNNLNAIGVNGSDGKCLVADYINKEALGLVGRVTYVNKALLFKMIESDLIPVITPIGASRDGYRLNINADYAAAAVASAIKAERCLFVTNVDGILINGEVVKQTTASEIHEFIEAGHIYGGMIPKVESALSVLTEGMNQVMIVSGKKAFYHQGGWEGTAITNKAGVVG
ncbi:acetylglutamate kinase [Mesobacillus maritimus]|uniref:acetylglutamate kinase n=1 Tax=Mesobacillus maritimus TaxID=1643336 RepID=UPI002042300F|nr:acetylglutamate kinase [Mesobacillus maritimus]MCM3586130.1 acetylglutamate kinase [Mesobacillus maritimus]MCM3667457.1 acetylglutamate kinase [Mesobacillus maritimus]